MSAQYHLLVQEDVHFIMNQILGYIFYGNIICLASYVEGYPLDLSILISGGKETKRDSPSNGERRGNSPSLNRVGSTGMRCGVKVVLLGVAWTKSFLDNSFLWDAIQGDSPVYRPCVV